LCEIVDKVLTMKQETSDIQSASGDISRRDLLASATFALVAGSSSCRIWQGPEKEVDVDLKGSDFSTSQLNRRRALLETRLKEITEVLVKDPCIPGVLVLVDAPQLGKPVTSATGFSDPVKEIPLQPIDQFNAASIGKMFTAASIMLLREKGLLKLDDTLAEYLPAQLLQGLSVYDGIDYGSRITLRQCLQHTSGLWDFYMDGPLDDKGRNPFYREFYNNRDKFWTPVGVIEFGKRNLEAVGAPGTVFRYSDTNFQLLGLVIERVTGKPLFTVVRELVLEPLKMEATYARFLEDERRPAGVNLSHTFDSELRDEDTPLRGIDMTYSLWESADLAAGGWLTTAPDLVKFLRGASSNRLFKNDESWQLMQKTSELAIYKSSDTGLEYHYGLGSFITDGEGEGEIRIGHFGHYGSFALLWPKGNVVMVGHYGQGSPSSEYKMSWGPFHLDVFKAVSKALSLKLE